jgi:predicted GNAT superfamily acetyltransferase
MSGLRTTVLAADATLASAATSTIQPLTTIEEFARCVELQRAVWAWGDLDIMPTRVFVLLKQVGGLVLGAYDDGELVGFVNCVPGVRGRCIFWHSHMMAVRRDAQNRGVGTALKLAQRAHALEHGIDVIQWVFDPLQAKNAHVNLVKLGTIVQRYSIDHYGASSSPLHAGLASDRLVAEWHLRGPAPQWSDDAQRIRIPADVQRLKRAGTATVRPLQLAVRTAFLHAFSNGFVVTDFERDADGGAYVLRRPTDTPADLP